MVLVGMVIILKMTLLASWKASQNLKSKEQNFYIYLNFLHYYSEKGNQLSDDI